MTKRLPTRFRRSTAGNLSITTSVVGLMLATAVGASLDGTRMFSSKASFQSITDAAALAATLPEGLSTQKRKDIAKAVIRDHAGKLDGVTAIEETIEVRGGGKQVHVALSGEIPLLFAGVLGADARRVTTSSLAEETRGSAAQSALSVSVVLDLSESMNDRFDTGTRLASVKAALSDTFTAIANQYGGEAAAATQFSTGLYPFNWGQVDGETVALEPGTANVLDGMAFLGVSEGSVPSEAIEMAVREQIDANDTEGSRDRYVVFLTDGAVDNEKDDDYDDFFERNNQAKKREAANLANTPDHLVSLVEGLLGGRNGGRGGAGKLRRSLDKLNEAKKTAIELCEPKQTVRVVEACEEAQENDISVISIDLSGKEELARDVTELCAGIVNLDEDDGNRRDRNDRNPDRPRQERLPGGLTVTVSADGQAMQASVNSLRELRAVLATLAPEAGETTRSVRLVY